MIVSEIDHRLSTGLGSSVAVDAKVVFLTHYIPLYQVRVLQSLSKQIRDFQILLSTPIEPNRDFDPDWADLNVTVQNTWTIRQQWRQSRKDGAFRDQLYVHIPRDTSQRLKQIKPDVVMSLELGARSLGAVRYCKKNPSAKSLLCTYMSEHTEQSRGRIRSHLRRWLVQQADALTYNGPSCKSYLNTLGVADDRMFHLPYAADDRTVFSGNVEFSESHRNKFLCIGQLSERKGVVKLLEQLTDYCNRRQDQQVEISFAGSGPMKETMDAIQTPANLTVRLLGNVPPAQLGPMIAESGAVIAPTLADEWLLVVNEAMHAGVPVIGSVYAQAATTIIQDGFNGWQYDPCDPNSIAGVLDAYFQTPASKMQEMRSDARESVSHRSPQWAASGALQAIRFLLNR